MAHIILLGCINDLMGNATTGKLAELKAAVVAADERLKEAPNQELHELLETIQPYVCGASTQVQQYTEDLEELM